MKHSNSTALVDFRKLTRPKKSSAQERMQSLVVCGSPPSDLRCARFNPSMTIQEVCTNKLTEECQNIEQSVCTKSEGKRWYTITESTGKMARWKCLAKVWSPKPSPEDFHEQVHTELDYILKPKKKRNYVRIFDLSTIANIKKFPHWKSSLLTAVFFMVEVHWRDSGRFEWWLESLASSGSASINQNICLMPGLECAAHMTGRIQLLSVKAMRWTMFRGLR